MAPIVTDAEKIKRRDKVKAKRRRRGKKCKPLPPRRRGSDLADFYHLSENVHRARRKVFGEEPPEGKAWSDERIHVFKHQSYATAWEKLIQWRAALRGKGKREAADWQRPNRITMQTLHETVKRLRPPLGSAQRHGRRRP